MSRALDALCRAYFRTPEHPAKYRIARWLGRTLVPAGGLVATVPPGVRMHLHPRDWIEYHLLRGLAYEPLTLEFLASNLRPGDCAVLAGVNNGLHAAVAARAVGPAGLVVGFEPQPAALLKAHGNLALNGVADRVRLVAAALGDRHAAGLAPMAWSDPANPGAASLLDAGPGVTVRVAPLAEMLPQITPARPRLLLLDVQGYETLALSGLDPAAPPDLVVVEALDDWLGRAGSSLVDLFAALRALGYDPFTLAGDPADEKTPLPEANVVGVRAGARVRFAAALSRA